MRNQKGRASAKQFAAHLQEALVAARMTAAELSRRTGIGKPSLSFYLTGRVMPQEERIEVIATALGTTVNALADDEDEPHAETVQTGGPRMRVTDAARKMGCSPEFIRAGLRAERLPIGWAVKLCEGRWTYYVSGKQLAQWIGEHAPCGTEAVGQTRPRAQNSRESSSIAG